jgi:hypothetical protein
MPYGPNSCFCGCSSNEDSGRDDGGDARRKAGTAYANAGTLSEARSPGMSIVTGSPSASSGLYPNNSTALVFQLVIMPLRSSLMIASSGDSTTDVR